MSIFTKRPKRPKIFAPEDFLLCGQTLGTDIMRYKWPDISRSGVVGSYAGGLLTAGHVVKNSKGIKIPGFKSHTGPKMDIAYRSDESFRGPPLGWITELVSEGVEIVTTSLDDPTQLVTIAGRLSFFDSPDPLRPFIPDDYEVAERYLRPGASGSPMLYKDHIIGVTVAGIVRSPGEVAAVVFDGKYMRDDMVEFGLPLEQVS
jgi:hypothetical protein